MKTDYEQVAKLLAGCGILNPAAEVHGIVCGQVSSGAGNYRLDVTRRLLGFDDPFPGVIEKLLTRFAEDVAGQLGGGDFSFQPLLPGDEEELGQRVYALGSWCEGFNLGFAAAYAGGESRMREETREVLGDFARIAEVEDRVKGEGAEQDEEDYTEIDEYVRMAAASVYLQNVPAPRPDDGPLLH